MTSKNYLPKFVRHQQSWVFGAAVWERGHLKIGHIGAGRLGAIFQKST